MEKLQPYVNLSSQKDSKGNIEAFIIKAVALLPKGSKSQITGGGDVADNVTARPVIIEYTPLLTKDFEPAEFELVIKRAEIGLLERGVEIQVKSSDVSVSLVESKAGNPESKGIIVDYGDD